MGGPSAEQKQVIHTTAIATVQEKSKWRTTSKGKGRTAPRSGTAHQAEMTVAKLTAISHSDEEHGELPGDPPPRYDAILPDGWVRYIHLDSPQNVYCALNALWEYRPVLLRESPLLSALSASWTIRDLEAVAPSPRLDQGGVHEVQVLCSDGKKHRFIDCDDSKNVPSGPYYLREPETQRLHMSLAEYVQCAARWTARRVMLRLTVMQRRQRIQPSSSNLKDATEDSNNSDSSKCPPISQPASLRATAMHFHDRIDWGWLSGIRHSQGLGPVLRVDLETGSSGGLLPARYDVHDVLLAQVVGRRRVLLIPPTSAFDGLYPYPVAHPYDRYAMVDIEALDPGSWPGCMAVRGHVAVLRPGDVLYVPPYWFAHEQDLEQESATLRFILHPGSRPPAPETTALRVSRALEERVAAVEGPSAVRRWLGLIGSGMEATRLDLGTVAGYRRAVMCQGVRDEVEESLGGGVWATLLPAMCRGRLMPTPWLNRDYREPLLLTDKPVIIEDTRNEEERKYPTLFRRKLEADGWSVPPSVSTVPVPGVNMPLGADYRSI